MRCRWDRLDQVKLIPSVHRAYGGDPLGLWGETDPEELLNWWLRIAANREEWRCIGRQHADAVKSLSWRESMRKLLTSCRGARRAPPLHPDSVLLITLDSCRYDSFRRSTTPAMDRVGLCTERWPPAISPLALMPQSSRVFCPACVLPSLCSIQSWPSCFV